MRWSLFITALVFVLWTICKVSLSQTAYLLTAIGILSIDIIYLNTVYYRQLSREGLEQPDDQT